MAIPTRSLTVSFAGTLAIVVAVSPATAIDFLGVELCDGSLDTRVTMPPGSSLVLESAEIGDNGGLVLLLSATSGKVMDHVDDLMTGLTGRRGEGDGEDLEWSGGRLTGVAQKVAKKYAALAGYSSPEEFVQHVLEKEIAKLEDAKARQKALLARHKTANSRLAARQKIHDYKIDDAMLRFEAYTRRIDDVEGRVEAYDLGMPKDLNHEFAGLEAEESVKKELDAMKARVAAERTAEAD